MKRECLVCGYIWDKNYKLPKYPYRCPNCLLNCWDFGSNIKCSICLGTVLTPTIHHIDGNHKNNIRENRVPLCKLCHLFLHMHRNKVRKGQQSTKKYRTMSKEEKTAYNFYLNKLQKFNEVRE